MKETYNRINTEINLKVQIISTGNGMVQYTVILCLSTLKLTENGEVGLNTYKLLFIHRHF